MIPDRFEVIARNYPNRLAVKTTKEELTYDELNKAANRVANAILQQCGEKEQPVALLLEHGAHMIVSILGVLKAGKIYVPLNPSDPSARIIETLQDSRAGLMVTNNLNVSVIEDSKESAYPRINLDCVDDSLSTENPGLSLPPKTLASILYTSGSTGRPKGVVGNHCGVLHRVMIYTDAFNICANDRLTLLHHCSVGAAETHLFCSLLNGAALYPFDLKKAALDALADLLIGERITIFHSGVNVYRELLHVLNREKRFPDLRMIKLGSDQITKKDVQLYREHFDPNCILVNALSMSEAGTVSWFVINKETRINDDRVPVGYPVEEKEILLLDETGEEIGYNRTGEIAIKSQYLSPGYWRRPELTKSKFLPDPNGGDNRTFLTGDLGRILSDGCLLHLGRKDFRVKIRGHTIEPAEVEIALLESCAVKEVAVVARETIAIAEDAPDDKSESDSIEPEIQNLNSEKRLVAYIVPKHETAPTINDLRNFLREKLPDYMIPSAFVMLDAMPLTPNGKVDRKALREPENNRPELSVSYVAPKTSAEKKLARIWAEVLSVDQVGIHDNFFDLGGHSLAGAAIISRAKEMFGIELSVGDLLRSPTVAEMSGIVSRQVLTKPKALKQGSAGGTLPIKEIEQSITDRFEDIVRQHPNLVAIETDDASVSFAELNSLANCIAHSILAARGSNSEAVGVLLEKGIEQTATVLGILKTGKYFVSLDPRLPELRIKAIAQDSEVALLITDQTWVDLAGKVNALNCGIINLAAIDASLSANNPPHSISPDSLACIFYTSGSTGLPKGVMWAHRNVVHSQVSRGRRENVSGNDRFAHITAGASNADTNLFFALLNGLTLLPFDASRGGVTRLANWLIEKRISICAFASPLFRQLCKGLTGAECFKDLRLVRLRSQSSRKSDVDLFRKFFPANCVLVNGLASSETGPYREFRIGPDTIITEEDLPVGFSIDEAEVFLVDETGETLGCNQTGEIVVRSKFLSPGYWRKPELTFAKFKTDLRDPERQLFYTGDLGLLQSNGCLILKGRKDFRVKIRGYGVELGEVEKALRNHSHINEAVVVAAKEQLGEARLVSYFTAAVKNSPTASELRSFLSKTLPDYMIPSAFVKLNALPLTPNGKVDRKALPEPDKTRPELSVSYVAPRTSVEEKLTQLWEECFGVESVGIHDDFFDLGGHSLSGARLVSLIHEAFHFQLPVSEFFAAPTIAQLAERIETESKRKFVSGNKAWTYLCELQRGKDRKPVFIFPGGGGGEPEFFVYGFLARYVGTEYPFYGLRVRGADGILKPHTSVEHMADAYVEEIRAIQPDGPYFLVGECAGGVNAYETARQLLAQGQQVAVLVLMDVERPRLTKYIRFRAGWWLDIESWPEAIRRRWYENYYIGRIPYHLDRLRSLPLRKYPRYLLDRIPSALKVTQKRPNSFDSRHDRADVVLRAETSGKKLRHIEWARENYRRTVRRFRPEPYDGHIELLVSEKLYGRDPTLGWKKLALKGLNVHPLPGNHEMYIREHVAVAGLKLRECLERAEKRLPLPGV